MPFVKRYRPRAECSGRSSLISANRLDSPLRNLSIIHGAPLFISLAERLVAPGAVWEWTMFKVFADVENSKRIIWSKPHTSPMRSSPASISRPILAGGTLINLAEISKIDFSNILFLSSMLTQLKNLPYLTIISKSKV